MHGFEPATADFQWLLRHVVPAGEVLGDTLDPSVVEQVIAAAADFIAAEIAPLGAVSDRIGVKLVDGRVVTPPGWRAAWAAWAANGWAGLGIAAGAGGQEMPYMVEAVVATMLGAADLAFAMVSASARSAASVLAAHATPAWRDTCLPRLASGDWTATIVITEPQAGTDVGQIRTRATRQTDGGFALDGTKIFISGGDHDLTGQILHIVLARIEGAAPGVKGLSLFLVPAVRIGEDGTLGARNAVSVARVEEKMGLHGSATCVLDFDGAEGWLIGAEGQGLQCLFTMMNELRLEVALSAVGIAASATRHARAYAEERRQGRDTSGQGPVAIIAHPDVARMIAIMRCLSDGGRALVLEAARLVDLERCAATAEARADAAARVAWLLPVCKAALSDNAVEVGSLGIQVRGGHGFVRESGAEQYLRDARVLPIYEGANGVHAGALATRSLQRDGGRAARAFLEPVRDSLAQSAAADGAAAIRACVAAGAAAFERVSALLLDAGASRPDAALAVSYDYLTLAGRLALGWMWLRMAAADPSADAAIVAEKRELAAFFAGHYGPEMDMLAARIAARLGGDAAPAPSLVPAPSPAMAL